MSNCAVASCRNYYTKTKGLSISYHPFPKDPFLRKVWMNKCKRKDKFNPNNSGICSAHFAPDEYEANKQNELLGIAYKKPLKKSAIPTLNLMPIDDSPKLITTTNNEEECGDNNLEKSHFENNNELVNSNDEEIHRLSQELKEVKQDLQIYKDKYKMAEMKIAKMIKVHVAAMRQQRKLQQNLLYKLKRRPRCACQLKN